jgi:hypothetical protein
MDYQLLALIALIIAVVIAATRQHSRPWPGRPGWQYQRVFSVGFAGLLFRLRRHRLGSESQPRLVPGHKMGGRTRVVADRLGSGLLVLADFWARRVPSHHAH